MKNPPILILDEATSALDNESEILVGQSLEKLAHGLSLILISGCVYVYDPAARTVEKVLGRCV